MIYEIPSSDEPIHQGDIFRYVPRIDINLESLPVANGDSFLLNNWVDAIETNGSEPITSLVAIKPVIAIVISQDCDAVRADDIALAEVVPFENVESNIKNAKYPTRTWGVITKNSRVNLKWFYLPIDLKIGFEKRMAADFRSVLQTSKTFLENHRERFRIARLNDIATQHFRERLSEYFRRYAYDEWYPLDKKEFDEYRKSKSEPTDPFDWQK